MVIIRVKRILFIAGQVKRVNEGKIQKKVTQSSHREAQFHGSGMNKNQKGTLADAFNLKPKPDRSNTPDGDNGSTC